MGGHKGSALALMVELLAGWAIGERFSFEAAEADNHDGGPPRGGEFMLGLSPELLAGPHWASHCEGFFRRFEAIPGARLPGARRHKNRASPGPRLVDPRWSASAPCAPRSEKLAGEGILGNVRHASEALALGLPIIDDVRHAAIMPLECRFRIDGKADLPATTERAKNAQFGYSECLPRVGNHLGAVPLQQGPRDRWMSESRRTSWMSE